MGFERVPCGASYSGGVKDPILCQGWLVQGQQDSSVLQSAWWELVNERPILAARLRVNAERQDNPGRESWDFEIPDETEIKRYEEQNQSKNADDKNRTVCIVDRRPLLVRKVYSFKKAEELPSDRVSVMEVADSTDLWASNRPLSMQQVLSEDRPMICIQICCFEDATMVCIAVPEVLHEEIRMENIAAAWSSCIRGKGCPKDVKGLDTPQAVTIPKIEEEPPAPPGWRIFTKAEANECANRLAWLDVWNNVWKRQEKKMEPMRKIYIPETVNNAIIEQAERDGLGDSKINSTDALLAWLIKNSHQDKTEDDRIIDIVINVNKEWLPLDEKLDSFTRQYLRRKLPTVSLPAMPVRKVVSELSLGQLALLIHDQIKQQTTPEAVNRYVLWRLWAIEKKPLSFGPSSYIFFVGLTSNNMMNLLHEVNFSTDPSSPPAKVIKLWSSTGHSFPKISLLPTTVRLGVNDPSGGIWANAYLTRGQWKRGFGRPPIIT